MTKNMLRFPVGALHFVLICCFVCGLSCGQFGSSVPKQISEQVEEVKSRVAPDERLDVFSIDLKKKGAGIVVQGEVSEHAFHEALFEALRSSNAGRTIIDSVRILPDTELGSEVYGIVRLSVANMRRDPSVRAELVSQALLGTVIRLLKKERGYYYIQNWDRYLGWISASSVVLMDSTDVSDWIRGPGVIYTANYGVVRERPGTRGRILVDLIPGARLKKLGMTGSWVRVQVPDGQEGYVSREGMVSEEAVASIQPDSDRVSSVAESFLGVPYLWGGTSAKGFDCSGFVQTVFRLNNKPLPRDANQIALEGKKVELDDDLSQLRRGDMLFFGSNPDRITHCGIYLGNQQFIHSSGWVRINSFKEEDPAYNARLREILRAARRIPLQ